MNPKISLTRSPTAKAPEFPATLFRLLRRMQPSYAGRRRFQEVTVSGIAFMSCEARRVKRDRRRLIVSLTAGEYFVRQPPEELARGVK